MSAHSSTSNMPDRVASPSSLLPLILFCWLVMAYAWLMGHIRVMPVAPWLVFSTAASQSTDIPYYPVCLFKQITHLPCAFCGLTRSFALILQGRWQQTWDYHLLAIPIFLGLAFFAVSGLLAPPVARRLIRILTSRPAVYIGLILLTVSWLWKLGHSPAYW